MPAFEQHIKQLELETGGLEGEQEMDLGLADETRHLAGIGVEHETHILTIGFQTSIGELARIAAGYDERQMRHARSYFAQYILGRQKVFLDIEIAMIEDACADLLGTMNRLRGTETGDVGDRDRRIGLLEILLVLMGKGNDVVGMREHLFELLETSGLDMVEELVEPLMACMGQGAIVVMLYIALAEIFFASTQGRMIEGATTDEPFVKDGGLEREQILEDVAVGTSCYRHGKPAEQATDNGASTVIIDLRAKAFELRELGERALVGAMQDDAYSPLFERLNAIEHIDGASIGGRVRNIEADDMELCGLHGIRGLE